MSRNRFNILMFLFFFSLYTLYFSLFLDRFIYIHICICIVPLTLGRKKNFFIIVPFCDRHHKIEREKSRKIEKNRLLKYRNSRTVWTVTCIDGELFTQLNQAKRIQKEDHELAKYAQDISDFLRLLI